MLEDDKNRPLTPDHRSKSTTTQDMQSDNDVSAYDRNSQLSNNTPNLGGGFEEPIVEETPEFATTTFKERIFGQFVRDRFESEIGQSGETKATTGRTTSDAEEGHG
jgi:hypothetical protein